MNYPSLSLKQDLIDEVFSKKKYGSKKQSEAIRLKKYHKIQKELRLQSGVVEECDQCEYKTSKYMAMYRHKRENHLVLKQKCSDCDFSNIYPNKVKKHFDQVHRGMKRRNYKKCRREWCEFAGTTNCLELQNHSLLFCKKCQLFFESNGPFKYHNDKIHEGVIFNCTHCDTYSTARKDTLEKHILSKHSEDVVKNQSRLLRFCKEEGCTYKNYGQYGHLKRHIETQHEGIIRFKCHVMNCSFRSSELKDFQRHATTHEKGSLKIESSGNQPRTFIYCGQEGCNAKVVNIKGHNKIHEKISVACDQKECNVKVENMRELKKHIAVTHEGGIEYSCKFKNCSFKTHFKVYWTRHLNRCKYQESKSVTNSDWVSVDMNIPSRIKEEL